MTGLLEVRDVAYAHPDGFRLEGVSFKLAAGDRVALAGPNGAGKSTLLKLLAGALAPSGGEVVFSGERLPPASRDRAREVAWVPQEMDAPDAMTVEELVGLGLFPRARFGGWAPARADEENLEQVLARLALEPLRRRPVGTLSGGERRRALLARGLAQGARVLLLDEPTAHLDPRHQAELLEVLKGLGREGAAVLLAIHDINWALESCGRVLLLADGRLRADGLPAETLTPDVLEKVYGARARVFPAPDGRPGHIRFYAQPQEETP